MLDNIEDSGIDTNRIQNFHKLILQYSQNTDVKHQIIFTATLAKLSDKLIDSEYCVGKKYEDKNGLRSLKFS